MIILNNSSYDIFFERPFLDLETSFKESIANSKVFLPGISTPLRVFHERKGHPNLELSQSSRYNQMPYVYMGGMSLMSQRSRRRT